MTVSANYLTTLYTSALGSAPSLLNTIYGYGTSAASSANPVQALQSAERNQAKDVQLAGAQPVAKAAVAEFTKAVTSAKSMAQLLANPAFMRVLLTANQLGDQVGYTALATKALTSKLGDPKSLVNQLPDARWKTLAHAYDFSPAGLANFQKPATIAAIANAYATANWQTDQDNVTPGLSNALAFKAQAASITSVDQILGNMAMRNVVTTTLGIPKQIAFQTINAQEQAISTRIDIKKFQDPKFVETFVQQYLVANAAAVAETAASAPSTPDLTALSVQGKGFFA